MDVLETGFVTAGSVRDVSKSLGMSRIGDVRSRVRVLLVVQRAVLLLASYHDFSTMHSNRVFCRSLVLTVIKQPTTADRGEMD